MTLHLRDDIDRLSRSELIDYVYALEAKLTADAEHDALQGVFHLQRQFGLTPHEARLLVELSDGRAHKKENLVARMYANDADGPEPKIIDVYICKIRRKLAGTPIHVKTIWGGGLLIEDTEPLKRAMAGEELARDAAPVPPRVGRPKNAHGKPRGAVRDEALAYLRRIADGRVATCTSKALIAACPSVRNGAAFLRELERRGHLAVLESPTQRSGGKWTLLLGEGAE